MNRTYRQMMVRYGFALATVALTVPLKLIVIDGAIGTVPPYLLFFFPVMLTAWWAGAGPGLLAVALNAVACAYYHHEPRHTLRIEEPEEALMLTFFAGEGLLVCWLMGRLRGARARAEEARRSQETFLAMVSHELRGPLNPALMEADARLDDPATPPALRPSFERIRRGIELETRLIDDLLDAVRLGRGRASIRLEDLDAHDAVTLALEACRPEWEARGQSVSVALGATGSRVRADGARLQQVAWNLVRNAVKFTPEGGSIAVCSRDEPGGILAIEVADAGAGIDPGELETIFAPFAQGAATVGRFGGLGLGLAICRSIVEAHGGRLEASSPGRGRGATFTLRLSALPRTGTEAAATPATGAVPAPGHALQGNATAPPRHLLIVEDDEPTAMVMAELLRHDGYLVTVAHSVADALAAPLERIDCVVSDLDLPDGNGAELLRRIRARRDVPGIALTGYDPRDFAEAGAPFAAHLVKPVDYPTLEAVIREVIEPADATLGR